MKVIVANYRFFVAGGPERYMFRFMEAARRRGIEVIPFSVNLPQNEDTPYSRYFASPRADALMYADTGFSFRNVLGTLRATVYNTEAERKLRKLIRDERPDVLYILHEVNHLSPSVIRAAKKEHIPVIHRISDFFMFCARYDFLNGNQICEACIQRKYAHAIRSRCVKGSLAGTLLRVSAMKLYDRMKIFDDVDLFVVPSAFTAGKLKEGGVDPEKIRQIPTFTDCSRVRPCYENQKYFLFLGRIAHQKGVIYAIRAMTDLKDTGYVLKITGTLSDTEEDRDIRRYVEEHGLSEVVQFVGFTRGEALETLIRGAVCIVCPAIWYENMPNTVIEAYAYGKPVVASRLGSLAEMVEDHVTGLLFRPGDEKELAEKLRCFISNEELSVRLGKNARKKCETEYGEALHMKRWMESVRELTDRAHRFARETENNTQEMPI